MDFLYNKISCGKIPQEMILYITYLSFEEFIFFDKPEAQHTAADYYNSRTNPDNQPNGIIVMEIRGLVCTAHSAGAVGVDMI